MNFQAKPKHILKLVNSSRQEWTTHYQALLNLFIALTYMVDFDQSHIYGGATLKLHRQLFNGGLLYVTNFNISSLLIWVSDVTWCSYYPFIHDASCHSLRANLSKTCMDSGYWRNGIHERLVRVLIQTTWALESTSNPESTIREIKISVVYWMKVTEWQEITTLL